MTTRPTIQSLAAEAARCFETRTRDDGTEFRSLTDDAPAWLEGVCMAAHYDMMPDDWRFAFIEDAIDAIAATKTEGAALEYVLESVSVYRHDLIGWLHSHGLRVYYLTGALEAYGYKNGHTVLALAQELERRDVFDLVWDALEEVRDR